MGLPRFAVSAKENLKRTGIRKCVPSGVPSTTPTRCSFCDGCEKPATFNGVIRTGLSCLKAPGGIASETEPSALVTYHLFERTPAARLLG